MYGECRHELKQISTVTARTTDQTPNYEITSSVWFCPICRTTRAVPESYKEIKEVRDEPPQPGATRRKGAPARPEVGRTRNGQQSVPAR
jgi:hypothetical protein